MKRVPADVVILISVIVLCAGLAGLVVHRQNQCARGNPAGVVARFIAATNRGDQREAALCLSKASLAQANRVAGDKTGTISATGKVGAKFLLKVVSNDGRRAKVVMKPASGLAHKTKSRYYIRGAFKHGVPYIVVSEDGVWKLDMSATEKLWFASRP